MTDDFSATFVDAAVAWFNVMDSETIFFQRVFHTIYTAATIHDYTLV